VQNFNKEFRIGGHDLLKSFTQWCMQQHMECWRNFQNVHHWNVQNTKLET